MGQVCGRARSHASVSATVSAVVRNVMPAATARPASNALKPGNPGIHIGRSDQGATPWSSRNSAGTQVNEASEPAASRAASSSTTSGTGGATALKMPAVRASTWVSMKAARSRTSMNCTGSSGGAGARTSPPSATRRIQYVNRSVGSSGPTMRPGRTMSARSGKRGRHRLLARHLQRAVGLVGDLLDALGRRIEQRRVLVGAGRHVVGVHRQRRHERVVSDRVGQQAAPSPATTRGT